MISAEKQYEHVCEEIMARNQYTHELFKNFLQLFSAIVGGSVWLSLTRSLSAETRSTLAILSTIVAGLVSLTTIVLIEEQLRGWIGYRRALARLDADNPERWRIPEPQRFPAAIAETVMIVLIVAAVAVFGIYNPFRLAN